MEVALRVVVPAPVVEPALAVAVPVEASVRVASPLVVPFLALPPDAEAPLVAYPVVEAFLAGVGRLVVPFRVSSDEARPVGRVVLVDAVQIGADNLVEFPLVAASDVADRQEALLRQAVHLQRLACQDAAAYLVVPRFQVALLAFLVLVQVP